MDFKESLKQGIELEKEFLAIIQKKYPCATLINAFKGYDIWIPEISIGIEIKRDLKSKETGNILVEIEFNNKPSALMTTTAQYWVFYVGEWLMIAPEKIKNYIMKGNYKWVEFIGNGDTKPKKAYILKLEDFKKECKIINN